MGNSQEFQRTCRPLRLPGAQSDGFARRKKIGSRRQRNLTRWKTLGAAARLWHTRRDATFALNTETRVSDADLPQNFIADSGIAIAANLPRSRSIRFVEARLCDLF